MKIIFNHTLRSIKANIAQPFIIIFTVTVVTMLLFAALSMKDLFYNFQLANLSRVAQDTDISVSGGIFSGERFSEYEKLHTNEIVYVDKYLTMPGVINGKGGNNEESTAVLLQATYLKDFISRYNSELFYHSGISDANYVYPGIWINCALAEKKGYKVGDEVEIFIGLYNRYETFTVTYIFENKGFFANSTIYNILTDFSAIGDKGLYTDAYIKLAEEADIDSIINDLYQFMGNPELDVGYAVDYEYIDRVVADNEKLLEVAVIFVIALVFFILFGAYNIVAKKRSSEMLVFKAAGASPVQLFAILLVEVVFYGLIGGFAGTVCGRFGMEVVVQSVIPGFSDAVSYSVWYYFLSFISGILISVIGALIPLIRLVKGSVRNQLSSGEKMVRKVHPALILIPLAVICACAVCSVFLKDFITYFIVLLIAASVVGLIWSAPYIFSLIAKLFYFGKGISKLSSVTVKRNSEAVSLSCLLGAVIAFAFVAINVVGIIIDASAPPNSRFSADYAVQAVSSGNDMDEIKKIISATPGVDEAYIYYYKQYDWVFKGRNTDLTIYAVNSSDDLDCVVSLSDAEKEMFDNEENAAVFSYDLLLRLNKQIGDTVTISLGESNNISFKIVSVCNTKTSNDRYIIANLKGLNKATLNNEIVLFNVSENVSHSDLYADLKEKLEARGCFILNFYDWAYAASVGVEGITVLLRILQIIVGLVGFAGIMNMTIAMLISRQREFGIFRATGLDDKKFYNLMFLESMEISLTGGIIGTAVAVVLNFLIPTFAELIDRYIAIEFPWVAFIIFLAGISVYALIYCLAALKYRMKKTGIERNII